MRRRMRLITALVSVLAFVASSCSGAMSLSEYAEVLEARVHEMNQRLDDALRAEPSPPTVEGVRALWAERADARWDFVEAFADLEPPEATVDLHVAALDLVTRLAQAETAVSQRMAEAGSLAEMQAVQDGPEAAAFAEIDEDAIAFCRAAEAHFDATETAAAFEDMPFIPPEMQKVIVVALRCTSEERGLDQ